MEQLQQAAQVFVAPFKVMQEVIHDIAVTKGWWNTKVKAPMKCPECGYTWAGEVAYERNDAECIALMHSEFSEALEALRKGDHPDEHCPEYNNGVIELADAIIRAMDLCERRGWPLAEALVAKVRFNNTRPYKHGGKKY